MTYLLIIAALLFINGLFVMAEMALVSTRKARLQASAARGDRSSQIALDLIEHPTRYLSTIQIVITVSGIGMGMFGEAAVADALRIQLEKVELLTRHAHVISVAITIFVLTIITLVFAELVPKRLGQMFPEGLARLLARPMDIFSRITSPLVSILSGFTNLILKLVPVSPSTGNEQAAEDEVRAIMASGAEEGVFHQSERQMVDRVLTLADQRIRTIMVPRPDIDFLDVTDNVQRVRVTLATSSHSHFPICDGGLDKLIGFVHVKDLVKNGLISDDINLRSLARKPLFIPESTTAIRLMERFRSSGTHIAFVLDEYGGVVGLVTLNDIIEKLIGAAPIGSDNRDQMVVKRTDGSLLLDGMVSIPELKELMGTRALPKEDTGDYNTLGGFIMTSLGRVPATGDQFSFDGYTFEVMDMDRSRVDRVLLTMPPKVDEPESP